METNFNFNSQVCTSKVQSERLLALGLKKETADMCYFKKDVYGGKDVARTEVPEIWTKSFSEAYIPAWSLHRLILLCKYNDDDFGTLIPREGTYDYLIESIAYRIKEGYFNKEYLEE